MPRAATTTDAFNAISETKRREIIQLLAGRERSVNELVEELDMAQPRVSKHLRVLREVGLVNVRKEGRTRRYRLNVEKLKPVYDWVRTFERFWDHQLAGIRQLAESRSGTPSHVTSQHASKPNKSNQRKRKRKG